MIRPILTELALFIAPFAIYAVYLWGTRAGVLHPDSWPLARLMWLTIAALALMFGSFLVLAQCDGEEARVVGGAVRNAWLKLPHGDVDIATTALPQQVMRRAEAAGFKPVPT